MLLIIYKHSYSRFDCIVVYFLRIIIVLTLGDIVQW